jgi:pyruvate ferredoxin oxidoreductase alpha subunit
VDLHYIAFKIAEQVKIPVMVNMDGFVLTHTVEPVDIPDEKLVRSYLPDYIPTEGEYLDVKNPITLGSFVPPSDYQEIRLELHGDLLNVVALLKKEFKTFKKTFGRSYELVDYYGDKDAGTVMVTLGSVAGTIKDAVDQLNKEKNKVGLLTVNCFRPFPDDEIIKSLAKAKKIIVLEKDISLGSAGALELEIKRALYGYSKANIIGIVTGLGGRDITMEDIKKYFKKNK